MIAMVDYQTIRRPASAYVLFFFLCKFFNEEKGKRASAGKKTGGAGESIDGVWAPGSPRGGSDRV